MNNDSPAKREERPRSSRPSRKLKFRSRVRKSVREASDRVLATDALWSVILVIAVLLALGRPFQRSEPLDLAPGQLAPQDFKAENAFNYFDRSRTDELRLQASDSVPDIYVHDRDRGTYLTGQLSSVFQQGREALRNASLSEEDPAEAVKSLFADRLPAAAVRALSGHEFDAALEREMTAALREVMSGKVVANKATLERESTITLLSAAGDREQRFDRFDAFVDLNEARNVVGQAVRRRLDLPSAQERDLSGFVSSFLDANVFRDLEATHAARRNAADAVQRVFTPIPRGALLAAAGQSLTLEDIDKIRASRAPATPTDLSTLSGLLLLGGLLAFFLWRYTRHHQRYFRKLEHLHSLLVTMLAAMLAVTAMLLWLARKVTDNLPYPFDEPSVYPYFVPLGAGAILVALLANGRIATVHSAFAAFLFGAANGWDAYLMLWGFLVQCAGVYAITTYRERAALLRAGFVVGGAGSLAAVALESVRGTFEPLSRTLYAGGLAFVGGAIGVGLLISFALPLLERMFNVLTDIRLLELSNLNTPLLSEFAVKAPGSYNHSLVVGTLAEEAAKAIGANSLFCRVAAFYHDIGKMNKPEYFVENQRGRNPHDRLAPSMSALIIAAHVKDGIKMARDAGLPEQIVDIIPQHHGTKLMTYFFEKAKSSADPSLPSVKREDFRYPGPKPQTREAAIFMLADGVEAAARTVDDPTPNRLREMIRKVTNSIVVTDELDQCELTFADLDKIQQAFLRCLVSMYHHRVDYPGFDFNRPLPETKPALRVEPGGRDRKTARSS